jgi:hypothetical protein
MKAFISTLLLILAFNISCLRGQTSNGNSIIFVGEKIELKDVPAKDYETTDTTIENNEKVVHHSVIMDNVFLAKYKVLKVVRGEYRSDTIEFTVFDHYGIPAFSKYQTVLLLVNREENKYYHEKYKFVDVYKTKNGKWATSGDHYKFIDDDSEIKPYKINVDPTVFYDLKKYDKSRIDKFFPRKYFKIKDQKAYPLKGVYIDDLFKDE